MLLQDMWNRPYVTAMVPAQHTQMLWNAMEDPNEDMHSSMHSDSESDRDSDDSDNMDSGSESYEKYDTDSYRRWWLTTSCFLPCYLSRQVGRKSPGKAYSDKLGLSVVVFMVLNLCRL